MHPIHTSLAVLTLIAFTPSAAEIEPDSPPKNPIGPLVELARKNMMDAMNAANKEGHDCLNLETATHVKPDAIKKLKLTSAEIKIALNYLRTKAEDACMSAAINATTVHILMFKTIEFEAYGRNDPEPFANSRDQFTPAEFCCGSAFLRLNSQFNYMRLSPDKRAALEAIPELQKPFNAFELLNHFVPQPGNKKP